MVTLMMLLKKQPPQTNAVNKRHVHLDGQSQGNYLLWLLIQSVTKSCGTGGQAPLAL